MTNILLTLLLVINFAVLASILYGFVEVSRVYRQIRGFITPEAEGKPSALAQTTQVITDMMGRSIVATIKATFMGKQSGDVRAENAVNADIAMDTTAIGAILGSFPTLRKSIKRNPALLDVAMGLLNKRGLIQSGSGNSTPSNGQPKFRL